MAATNESSIGEELSKLHDACRQELPGPGDWLTGEERVAVWDEASWFPGGGVAGAGPRCLG